MKSRSVLILGLVCLAATACIIYIPHPYEGDSPYPGEEYRGAGDRYYYSREYGLDMFDDLLNPYGYWVERSPHGFVWVPHAVGFGWQPYTYGRWLWTDHGWFWASSFDWGWACFHYGRWDRDDQLGWYWVPGSVWAPAWVSWRWGSNHIGWAPIPPDVRFRRGVGIYSLPYTLRDHVWVFVEYRNFYDTRLDRWVLPRERNRSFILASQLRTELAVEEDRVVNRGITLDELSDRLGRRIMELQLRESRTAGPTDVRADEVYTYRPRLKQERISPPPQLERREEVRSRVLEQQLRRQQRMDTQPLDQQIRRRQDQEVERLQESQRRELEHLKQEAQSEKRRVSTRAERERIEKQYQEQESRARRQHKEETSRIKERHTPERTKVSKKVMTKKKKK